MSNITALNISLENSRQINNQLNGGVRFRDSFYTAYANRHQFAATHTWIMEMSFLDFCLSFEITNTNSLKPRSESVRNRLAFRILQKYSCNPQGPYYGRYCKYEVLKYKVWTETYTNALLPQCQDDDQGYLYYFILCSSDYNTKATYISQVG